MITVDMSSLICFLGVPYSSTYIFVFNNTIHISQCSSKNTVSQIKMSEFAKILWSAWILYHCRRDSNPVYRMVGKYGCTTTYGGPRKFVLLFQPKHRSNRRWNVYCDDFLFFKFNKKVTIDEWLQPVVWPDLSEFSSLW